MPDVIEVGPADAQRIERLVDEAKQKVSRLLGVSQCDVRLRIVGFGKCAWTSLSSDVPTITIPRSMLSESILAHELAHCFIPVCNPFEAEGFASWAGCVVGGNCHDFAFWESTPKQVIEGYAHILPPLSDLLFESPSARHFYSPNRFHHLDSRLAHMMAAAICEFVCSKDPGLPRRISNGKESLLRWIQEEFVSAEAFEAEWRNSWSTQCI